MSIQLKDELPFLDLYGADFLTNPHTVLRSLREQHPCINTALGVAILGYRDVREFQTNRQFCMPSIEILKSQGFTEGLFLEAMEAFLINTEGEAHTRVRRLASRGFTFGNVDEFRPRMRAIANELIDDMIKQDVSEFMSAFAYPYAWRALSTFVGFPTTELAQVQAWNDDIVQLFGFNVAEHTTRIESSLKGLYAFVDELVAQKKHTPTNDILSILVQAAETGEQLTNKELRAMILSLLSAGTVTTVGQLGNGIIAFIDNPDQWRLLTNTPTLVDQAVKEVMRFTPMSILGIPRVAIQDVVWNDLPIKQGECIMPIAGSANRDVHIFDDPDIFDITRKRQPHVSFGGGIHYCMGAAFAEAELQEALLALESRLGDLHYAGQVECTPPSELLGGPVKLPIRYTVR